MPHAVVCGVVLLTHRAGTWVNGVLEGEGEEQYPESSPWKNYVGSFRADRRDGQGTMVYRDGAQYRGEWRLGERAGRGILTAPQRPIMRYEGAWLNDKFDGKGEVFFQNLDRYQGAFSAGCMHGQGLYTYANGVSLAGEWKQGVRQRKLLMAGAPGGVDLELLGSKDRAEMGEARLEGKMQAYFVPPARPDIDSTLLELEIVPESAHNLVTNARGPRGDATAQHAAALTQASLASTNDLPAKRRSSFFTSSTSSAGTGKK